MYIGFGSLLVDNPKGLTEMILSAARRTDQRIILCRCCQLHLHSTKLCLPACPPDCLLHRDLAAEDLSGIPRAARVQWHGSPVCHFR